MEWNTLGARWARIRLVPQETADPIFDACVIIFAIFEPSVAFALAEWNFVYRFISSFHGTLGREEKKKKRV